MAEEYLSGKRAVRSGAEAVGIAPNAFLAFLFAISVSSSSAFAFANVGVSACRNESLVGYVAVGSVKPFGESGVAVGSGTYQAYPIS